MLTVDASDIDLTMKASSSPSLAAVGHPVGTWWRCSDYEIRHGVIFPAANAIVESYNPWDGFYQSLAAVDAYVAPASLQQLLNLRTSPEGVDVVRTPSDDEILSWVRRFGLLGILLNRTASVVFPTRSYIEFDDAPDGLLRFRSDFKQFCFSQSAGSWTATETGQPCIDGLDHNSDGEESSDIVSDRLVHARDQDAAVTAHVVIRELPPNHNRLTVTPFGEAWGPFFDVPQGQNPDWYDYPFPPMPGLASRHEQQFRFWERYGEPVLQFLQTIDALKALTEAAISRGTSSVRPNGARGFAQDLFAPYLGGLGAEVIGGDTHQLAVEWSAGSLVSTYAAMMFELLRTGRTLVRCQNPNCNKWFLRTGKRQRKHCPDPDLKEKCKNQDKASRKRSLR